MKIEGKKELVWTTDYTNVLIADISIIIVLMLLTVFWKDQRILMFVGLSIYSFLSLIHI